MYWLPMQMGPGCRADSCLLRPGEESERGRQWAGHPAPLLVLSQLCRATCMGPGQGRGQECFSRSLVLEGLTVCPSCQDLPDPVHDAAEVQLPHCGSAFHDETGEETSACQTCRGSAQPQGVCPGSSVCLEHSSCRPSLSWSAFLSPLLLDCGSPVRAGPPWPPPLCPGLIQ